MSSSERPLVFVLPAEIGCLLGSGVSISGAVSSDNPSPSAFTVSVLTWVPLSFSPTHSHVELPRRSNAGRPFSFGGVLDMSLDIATRDLSSVGLARVQRDVLPPPQPVRLCLSSCSYQSLSQVHTLCGVVFTCKRLYAGVIKVNTHCDTGETLRHICVNRVSWRFLGVGHESRISPRRFPSAP